VSRAADELPTGVPRILGNPAWGGESGAARLLHHAQWSPLPAGCPDNIRLTCIGRQPQAIRYGGLWPWVVWPWGWLSLLPVPWSLPGPASGRAGQGGRRRARGDTKDVTDLCRADPADLAELVLGLRV